MRVPQPLPPYVAKYDSFRPNASAFAKDLIGACQKGQAAEAVAMLPASKSTSQFKMLSRYLLLHHTANLSAACSVALFCCGIEP